MTKVLLKNSNIFLITVRVLLPWYQQIFTLNLSGISHFSTTQTFDAVYIIGGLYTQDIVAEFKNDQWRRLADLNQGRYGHGSITIEGQTMIIGGYFNSQT